MIIISSILAFSLGILIHNIIFFHQKIRYSDIDIKIKRTLLSIILVELLIIISLFLLNLK